MNKLRLFVITLLLTLISFLYIPVSFSADEKPALDKDQIEFKLRKEEITFIPYRELSKLLDKNKKLVFISYKELQDLINEKSQIRPLAPVNYVIKDLSLNGTVNNDHISFDAKYKIQILNKEWVYIPILSTQVGLKVAEFDGNPAPISTDGTNFQILSDVVGEHELKLKFDVKINESGNTKSFQFNMPVLPIARLAIDVPEVPVKLNILNASGERSEIKEKRTITYANLMGQGSVQVDWKSNLIKMQKPEVPKIVKEPEYKLPSKVIANVETLISIDEGILQGFSTYNCQIFHRPVEKLSLHIPDDVEILSVSSSGDIVQKGQPVITDPNKNKPGKVLTVYFNSKIKDNATFDIAFQKTFENKEIIESVPSIYLIGKEISKSEGAIAIQSLGNIEIKQDKLDNLTPSDDIPATLEENAQNPILLSYIYVITDIVKDVYALDLVINPSKDASVQVAMIDKVNITTNLSSNGILITKADYTIRNMSEQYFRFNLPEGSEVLGALINENRVQVEKENDETDKKPDNQKNEKKAKGDDPNYLINIKGYQDEKPFALSIMYKQDKKFNILNHLFNLYDLQSPNVLDIPTLTLVWNAAIPDGLQYWYLTGLNRGYTDYSTYFRTNIDNTETYNYAGDKFNEYQPQAQVNVVSGGFEDYEQNKAVGVLPPRFQMPPEKGLIKVSFSDYLMNPDIPVQYDLDGDQKSTKNVTKQKPEFPTIKVVGVTKLIFGLLFLLMFYLGYVIAERSYNKVTRSTTITERAWYFIPLAIVLYLAGQVFGFWTIWFPVLVVAVIYIIFRSVKNSINKK